MSHNGLIDASKLSDPKAAFICARLYLRNGKRRLQKGRSGSGMAALYDAVLFGMHYYIAKHNRCASFLKNTDPWDAAGMFHALARAGVFNDPLTFNRFSLIVERALWQESFSFDPHATLAEVETMLTKLGVMPFNESALPRELESALNNQIIERR
jgi:hypothetical protein